jgi:2-dehydro-3-deoxyphosphogluconate aldolase / (4S)-4-hydroxy-2-oxoglutarate aldolase
MKTSNSTDVADSIGQAGVVVIMRIDDTALILDVAQSLYRGGIRCFEVPMTTPNTAAAISRLTDRLPSDAIIGAGTVLDQTDASSVIDAGAAFIVSPHFEPSVAQACQLSGTTFIPGAFSPREIYEAWRAGADIVKVFSIRPLGTGYISDLLGPYPSLRLMPTGGIRLDNAIDFIKAGSFAVTIGRDLIGDDFSTEAAHESLYLRAKSLVSDIQAVKNGLCKTVLQP